ncbi:hypothetical protein GO304_05044 [Ralstonia solanacearum]|nr:hypothetical protein [Ralstonia solanacearum]
MRQAVCLAVQLPVAQRRCAVLHRDRLRRAGRLGLHQARQRRCARVRRLRPVPTIDLLMAFRFGQQGDLSDLGGIVRRHRLQQVLQIAQVALDRRPIEQRRRVVQRACDPAAVLVQGQGEIELCGVALVGQVFDGQPIEFQHQRFRVLPQQCGLEHRAVRQAAHWPDPLHYLLEWQILMGLGFQHLCLHAPQQFRDRRAPDIHPECQRVHEDPDQALHLAARAVRYRRAHHHLFLARQAAQQRRPTCQHRHEQCRSVSLAQPLQVGAERLVEYHFHRAARVVLLRRPCPVRRQAQQRRGTGQGLFPICALPLQFRTIQPSTLPDRVVRVLDRQGRQRVLTARSIGLVQHAQFARQHTLRPAVRHDVVHRDQQHVFLLAQLYQAASDQRALLQVERGSRLRLGLQAELVLRHCLGAQVDPVQRQSGVCRCHALHGLSVLSDEARAQRFVPRHDPVQRAAQCILVQLALQPQPHGDVVRLAAPFHLRQEPQSLLRER